MHALTLECTRMGAHNSKVASALCVDSMTHTIGIGCTRSLSHTVGLELASTWRQIRVVMWAQSHASRLDHAK
jgi:hypothetical protein